MKRLNWVCLTSIVAIVGMTGCQGTKGTSALKDGTCYASRGLYTGISDDELMLPIDKDSNYTNADVIVYMVNVESDESAPREKLAYPFQKEFLNDYVQNNYAGAHGSDVY